MKQNRIKISALVFGLLVIAAGVLLFAFNANMLPMDYKPIVFSWPMLMIAVGFILLFSRHNRFSGILLMLMGAFFLLPKLDIEALSFMKGNGWAIALILIGILGVFRGVFNLHYLSNGKRGSESRRSHKQWNAGSNEPASRTHWQGYPRNETGYIERNYVFGGSKEKLLIPDFKGGEINSVFGGTELDFSGSQLAEGIHYLEISTVFGGVVLYVPADWKIELRQTRVFGSFEDRRPPVNFEVDDKRVLIIQTASVFGGGELRCK